MCSLVVVDMNLVSRLFMFAILLVLYKLNNIFVWLSLPAAWVYAVVTFIR
jgi:hypothetical protein